MTYTQLELFPKMESWYVGCFGIDPDLIYFALEYETINLEREVLMKPIWLGIKLNQSSVWVQDPARKYLHTHILICKVGTWDKFKVGKKVFNQLQTIEIVHKGRVRDLIRI